jgi:hypothetical protein
VSVYDAISVVTAVKVTAPIVTAEVHIPVSLAVDIQATGNDIAYCMGYGDGAGLTVMDTATTDDLTTRTYQVPAEYAICVVANDAGETMTVCIYNYTHFGA